MQLSNSPHLVGARYGQPAIIESIRINEATGRPVYFRPGPDSLPPHSRHNKTCVLCGKPKNGRGASCRPCYQEARKVRVVLRCVRCDMVFERPRYEYEKMHRRGHSDVYCSFVCSQADHAVKWRKPCPVCGTPKPERNNKYCSPACRRVDTKRKLPNVICGQCGVFFVPFSSRTQYCSRTCANKAHSQRMVGEGNSRFKAARSYAEWFRRMRPVIMERDHHRCVGCGKLDEPRLVKWRGREIMRSRFTIHHVNEDVLNNTMENLVTLCGACHIVHHKSNETPFPELANYARRASASTTSRLKEIATSLQTAYSSTTA